MPTALQIATGVLVPLVLAVITKWTADASARRQSEASPYAVLAERVVALERRDAERDEREAQMHAEQLIDRDCILQLVWLFERRFPGETLSICLPDWYTNLTPERNTQ